jgi:hypothetical protein
VVRKGEERVKKSRNRVIPSGDSMSFRLTTLLENALGNSPP